MTEAICCRCIQDEFLRKEVVDAGLQHVCSECGEIDAAITVEDLGKRLEPLLRNYYVPGETYRVFSSDDDDRGYDEQHGDTLSDILQEVLGQDFKCQDDIVSAVQDADHCWPPDGENAYWDEFTCYVFRGVSEDPEEFPDWHGTEADLKHGMRFFCDRAKQLFDGIFSEIDSVDGFEVGEVLPVTYAIPPQTKMFRARTVASSSLLASICSDPGNEVGPPPAIDARAGRMNPEGVAVLYAAMDQETCIAEMRPAIGNDIAVVAFSTTRPVRILDFTRLERAFRTFSYFDPQFDARRRNQIFLRRLHHLISRPIVPGREFDYLITQTMAEYLSCVYPRPFDGVKFRSAQRKGGINIVLLPGMRAPHSSIEERFGVVYDDGSLTFARVSAVHVSYDELTLRRTFDECVRLESLYEDYRDID